MYLAHVRHDRVDATASPKIRKRSPSAVLVDAGNGFAFPACATAITAAIEQAGQTGISIAAVTNSHHFGVAGNHLLKIAEAGMVGWAMGNSPAAMPAWGGKRAIFGTNPIAAIFPRRQADPLLIDLSLSEVARGKIMVAAKAGNPIPQGWALDAAGNPTTDAKAALTGMMLPMGGVKGAMLALMVELMVTTLTGAHFGAEADSFSSTMETGPNSAKSSSRSTRRRSQAMRRITLDLPIWPPQCCLILRSGCPAHDDSTSLGRLSETAWNAQKIGLHTFARSAKAQASRHESRALAARYLRTGNAGLPACIATVS